MGKIICFMIIITILYTISNIFIGFNNYIPDRLNIIIMSVLQLGTLCLILIYLNKRSKERRK